jgi:short-subunit dehydrogenase
LLRLAPSFHELPLGSQVAQMMKRRSLAGAVVVITGASSGIGRATAHAFARKQCKLVLAARGREALEESASECAALGAEVLAIPTDVARNDEVEALASSAAARFGVIDVWVNCAAVLHYGRFEETPSDVTERLLQTNLFGCFNGARAALRRFREQGHGTLINCGSVLGLIGHAYTAPYVASKFAILGLTSSLQQEVQDASRIHVCAVLPAAIDTPIYRRAANFTGRAIRPIRPIYPPQLVARRIVDLALRPKPRSYAGGFARLVAIGNLLAPAALQRAIRIVADAMEIKREQAPLRPGNVFEPIHDGYRVTGQWRERRWRPAQLLLGLAAIAGAGLFLKSRHAGRP